MEYASPEMERQATQEEREYVNRALFQYGLYSAALDEYPIEERIDERWIVPSAN